MGPCVAVLSRRKHLALVALPVSAVMALGGCSASGAPDSEPGRSSTGAGVTFPLAITTLPPSASPATPATFARQACIDFNTLAGFVETGGQTGGEVASSIGGMLQPIEVAVSRSNGDQQWVRLQADMEALRSLALTNKWPPTPAAARLPQTARVISDCKAVTG